MLAEFRTLAALALALAIAGCGSSATPEPPRPTASADAAAKDAEASRDAATTEASGGSWTLPEITPPPAGSSEPYWLSQTGLYRDIADKTLAPDLLEFEPTYRLWSDGTDKRRFLRLPEGARIDTSDMDHWVFPVGTMLFKEFSQAGSLLETRLIMRVGAGPTDYFMGAFVWNDDASDARFVPDGEKDVRQTEHDAPNTKQCGTCHNGEPGRILGLSAVQAEPLAAELLTNVPAKSFVVPGDETTRRALGYLHANCGSCHNLHGTAWPDTDMDLRLRITDGAPDATALYRSTVDVAMSDPELRKLRIVAGDPAASGVHYRMSLRGPKTQMPPIATEHVDERGLAAISAFIEALP